MDFSSIVVSASLVKNRKPGVKKKTSGALIGAAYGEKIR